MYRSMKEFRKRFYPNDALKKPDLDDPEAYGRWLADKSIDKLRGDVRPALTERGS